MSHIRFDDPVELTLELAEQIDCGLPQIITTKFEFMGPPMVCVSVDQERGIVTYSTPRDELVRQYRPRQRCRHTWPLQACERGKA